VDIVLTAFVVVLFVLVTVNLYYEWPWMTSKMRIRSAALAVFGAATLTVALGCLWGV
jgi:hypothetical protein